MEDNTQPIDTADTISVVLQRLGITAEEVAAIDEKIIRDKVLGNPELTSEYEKEIRGKQDFVLVNKLKKVLQKHTGISEEDIKDDVDYDKLVGKALSKITPSSNLEDVFRAKELEYEKRIEEYEAILRKKDEDAKSQIFNFKLETKAASTLKSLTLTPQAKDNLEELKATALASVISKYKFKEVDGQVIAYNDKGEKMYKKGTSFPVLLEDALAEYVERFGFIQKTDVNVDPMKAKQPSSLQRKYKF